MEMGAVGAVGAVGGMGAMAPAAGMAMGGAASAPATVPNAAPALSGMTPQMQALADAFEGFSSAQILMALMMSRGSREQGSGGGGVDALVGFALAGQAAQMMEGLSSSFELGSSGMCGSVGCNFDMSA